MGQARRNAKHLTDAEKRARSARTSDERDAAINDAFKSAKNAQGMSKAERDEFVEQYKSR